MDMPWLTREQVFAITSRANLIGGEGSEAYMRVMKAKKLSALQEEVRAACRRGGLISGDVQGPG